MTLTEIENALDSGQLKYRTASSSLWSVRRNGATKTWKTRPGAFRIPIKIGWRAHDYITESTQFDGQIIT